MKTPSSIDRLVLGCAVVVAGDGAGADVDIRADRGIAEIGQVVGLGARAERRLLELDEVADVRLLADVGVRPQVRERADARAGCDASIR